MDEMNRVDQPGARGSLFSSARERRLWLWAAAVVVAIYSTLGLARTLAGILRAQGVAEAAFWLGLLLIGAAVVLQGLRARPRGLEIGMALGIAGAYLIVFLRMAIAEERTHLIEYSVVALLIYEALAERVRQGRTVSAPGLIAILATSCIGAMDEAIQAFLPGRVFDVRDIGFNVLAGLMAVGAAGALAWVRRRTR